MAPFQEEMKSKFLLEKIVFLGANSGLGIPLGDRCTIEAGLYLTSGSKVEILGENGDVETSLKASELANKPDLYFLEIH